MSTIDAASSDKKKSRGILKRLTIRLKRKGEKHSDDNQQIDPDSESLQQEKLKEETAKEHMENMMQPTNDLDESVQDEEQNKSKSCTEEDEEKGSTIRKRSKREHLRLRSKKYALTKIASRGRLEEEDAAKGKEEDSDANIPAVEEQGASTAKKSKEEKKKEKKAKKEKRKSRKHSLKLEESGNQSETPKQNQPAQTEEVQMAPVINTAVPAPALPVVQPLTGRPVHHPGFIRPVSCPPQRFEGELSNYGLRAIEDAIKDVTGAIAPELQPNTPQMTLATFVEVEQSKLAALPEIRKPNLPSFDLPPPPSPPQRLAKLLSREKSMSGSGSTSIRPRSIAIQVSHEDLAKHAFDSPSSQSPVMPSEATAEPAQVVPPVQFNAQPSTVSDTNERVKVGKASIARRLSSSSSAKRAQRRTVGPVPSFKLFSGSGESAAVPLQLPPISPIQAHKRHADDIEENANRTPTAVRQPEAKCPRLEDENQTTDADVNHAKTDFEAGYDAVVELAMEGKLIEIEKRNAKPKPAINPEEIKLLQQEHQETILNTVAPGTEVAIYIAEGPLDVTSEVQEAVISKPEDPRPEEDSFEIVVAEQNVEQAAPAADDDAKEDDEEEILEEEEPGQTEEQPSQQQQQNQGKSRRRRKGRGRNRHLRKQNTRSRLR